MSLKAVRPDLVASTSSGALKLRIAQAGARGLEATPGLLLKGRSPVTRPAFGKEACVALGDADSLMCSLALQYFMGHIGSECTDGAALLDKVTHSG
ncbi:hypothetical protein NDU88_010355 [Pleurodeles waltl]|uniref:Uncharacterized protein n=1 Tax=Pleurodeles waltl TaxID=8319 RepID=A0AAV7RYT3_PLEWA|nr:hypothetical protein NDU88_010355 [Pleurodeles waltl]